MKHTIANDVEKIKPFGMPALYAASRGQRFIVVTVREGELDAACRIIGEVLDARTYDELIAGECRQPERPKEDYAEAVVKIEQALADLQADAARDIIAAKDAHIADLQKHLGRLERLVYMLCEHLPEGDEE